jgi:hypothetical protein
MQKKQTNKQKTAFTDVLGILKSVHHKKLQNFDINKA